MLLFINYYKPMTFIHEKYTTQYILNNAIQNLNATIYIDHQKKRQPQKLLPLLQYSQSRLS